jgi:hypothetical protein
LGDTRFTLQGALLAIQKDIVNRPDLPRTLGHLIGAVSPKTSRSAPNVYYIDTDSILVLKYVDIDSMHLTVGQLEGWNDNFKCLCAVFDDETPEGGYCRLGVVAKKAYFCERSDGLPGKIRFKGMSTRASEHVDNKFCWECNQQILVENGEILCGFFFFFFP